MEDILRVENVSKTIGMKQILQKVSLSIAPGEIVGLVGPNGAGKTSLMKLIAGYNFPDEGKITICGQDVGSAHAAAMKNAAFLVEEPGLYPQLTGRQHLHMVCDTRGIPRTEIEKLSDLLNFEKQLDNRVKTYSIGMKQRLGIALCFAAQPQFLVLDEPLNGLDPDGIFLIRERMKEASEKGMAILISSHLLTELQKVASRFVFLHHGEVIGESGEESEEALENKYRSLFSEEERQVFHN